MTSEASITITHWTARRKATIVVAVRTTSNERQAILAKHEISEEEFASWERDYDAAGPPALRSTKLHIYHAERRR